MGRVARQPSMPRLKQSQKLARRIRANPCRVGFAGEERPRRFEALQLGRRTRPMLYQRHARCDGGRQDTLGERQARVLPPVVGKSNAAVATLKPAALLKSRQRSGYGRIRRVTLTGRDMAE